MNITPEIAQLILALSGLIGVLTGYIKLRSKIEKTESDAKYRETQIKAAALAREAQLKAGAELIQQTAQTILNDMATSLQKQITTMQGKYDELQGSYTTLITDNASLASSYLILEQTTEQALSIWKEKHGDALAQMNAATVKFTEAQKQFEDTQRQLKESERARMLLLNTVNELEKTIALQEGRILALETQMILEKQLREKAELLLAAQEENCNNGKDVSVEAPDNASQSKVSSEKVEHD